MNCELCGKKTDLYETIIEGTKLDVCMNCSSFGEVIGKKRLAEDTKKDKTIISTRAFPEEKEIIVEDYANIIKTAREKKKLTQEELARAIAEKESIIHKIESGQIMPQMKTIKKFEQFLRIRLMADYSEEKTPAGVKINFGDNTLTIGDLVKIKEKKKNG